MRAMTQMIACNNSVVPVVFRRRDEMQEVKSQIGKKESDLNAIAEAIEEAKRQLQQVYVCYVLWHLWDMILRFHGCWTGL